MSQTLSCLTLRRLYDRVELYTDRAGYQLLIEELGLPYTDVHVELDRMNAYPSALWAIGKIYAYSMQQEPFIHVDNDVFMWNRLPRFVEEASLLAQNNEVGIAFNDVHIRDVLSKADVLPRCMSRIPDTCEEANAGIIGGSDTDFFGRYARQAFEFVDKNLGCLDRLRYPFYFNTVFEQYLYACMARREGKKITYAFDNVDAHFTQVCRFDKMPQPGWYVHACGVYKKIPAVGGRIAARLQHEFPDYYGRVVEWFLGRMTGGSRKEQRGDSVKLSVVIPTFNAGWLVRHSLQSVEAQTCRDVEIVVVDDGSTDDTVRRVEELAASDSRVRLVCQSHRGMAAARNRGIAECRGEAVIFVDAGDYLHPQFAELLLRALVLNPGADLCMTNAVDTVEYDEVALGRRYDEPVMAFGDGCVLRRALFMGYRRMSS
ncbi:MAG: glycosyltransferase family 2 protein, partial [Paludibacteraceae bacterium]|nr:glycosyltransferase family 2 protein [Paludibacteraceae bacterium]